MLKTEAAILAMQDSLSDPSRPANTVFTPSFFAYKGICKESECDALAAALCEDGLISMFSLQNGKRGMKLTRKGLAYRLLAKERKSAARRKWLRDALLVAIGAVIGALAQWLASRL